MSPAFPLGSTRACLHSSGPEHCGDDVDHRGEAGVGLFVARGDASKRLDGAEEVFDHLYFSASCGACPVVPSRSGMTASMPLSAKRSRSQLASNALSPMTARQAMPAMRTSKLVMSCRWPGRSTKRTRLPSASTSAAIFVVKPPRDLPMA